MIIAAFAVAFTTSGAAWASSGWGVTDPNARTIDTPALALFRGSQVDAIRGEDNALWYNVGVNIGGSGVYHRIGGTTYAAPALSEFNDNLYLFQTGQDGNLYYQTLANPDEAHASWRWSSARSIPGVPGGVRVTLRPAIGSSGNQLHIIAVGNNERIYHSALFPNGSWSGSWTEVPGGARTESGPAVSTTPDGYIVVEHRGTNNLMYTQWGDIATGVWAGSWVQQRSGTTTHAPALSYNGHDNRLVQAWTEPDGRVMTSESSTRGVDQTVAIPAANNVTSNSGPGLAYEGNGVGLTIRSSNFTDIQNMIIVNNYYYA
ncbi:hypothetical protein ACWEAF_44525 [Streptomyces sp. NPDC005071]|uniref:hypothetical protein n=1 Tax=Streptomyces sp. 900116325 TaxID=3154295 RepID=UPI0033B0BDB9